MHHRSSTTASGAPFASRYYSSSSSSTDTTEDSSSSSSILPLQESSLRSVTFCNIPKDQEPDLLCDFLLEIGASSASLTDSDRGTPLEQPIFGEPTANNKNNNNNNHDPWQDSLQWAAPVWNRCNVTAHFPASVDLTGVVEMVQETFPGHVFVPPSVTVVPNKDWVVHVQQQWTPIVVGNRFVLRFPWHTETHVQQALQNSASAITKPSDRPIVELQLQGGIAFGTGEHPTTQLCLEWLNRVISDHTLLRSNTDDDDDDDDKLLLTVLDYGAGSGILGMAACAMARSRVQAVGIDIDVDACQIANANAVQNHVNMKTYVPPLVVDDDDDNDTKHNNDNESKSLLLKAHAHAQKQLAERNDVSQKDDLILPPALQQQQYDVVVANILAGPLVSLAPTLYRMTKRGGCIGMSGILPSQDEMIIQAYQQAGFEHVQVENELNGWILVTGRRPTK